MKREDLKPGVTGTLTDGTQWELRDGKFGVFLPSDGTASWRFPIFGLPQAILNLMTPDEPPLPSWQEWDIYSGDGYPYRIFRDGYWQQQPDTDCSKTEINAWGLMSKRRNARVIRNGEVIWTGNDE